MTIPRHGVSDFLITADPESENDWSRLKVDSQQTSFEENAQFRYFDQIKNVAFTDQIVYKVIVGENAINLFERSLNMFVGGREYLAYLNDGTHTFTGTLADSGRVTPMNSNLRPGLESHPATDASIQRAIGAGIFTPGSLPFSGVFAVSSGNENKTVGGYSESGGRLGVAAGSEFFIVMNPIGANSVTTAMFTMSYEERFAD